MSMLDRIMLAYRQKHEVSDATAMVVRDEIDRMLTAFEQDGKLVKNDTKPLPISR